MKVGLIMGSRFPGNFTLILLCEEIINIADEIIDGSETNLTNRTRTSNRGRNHLCIKRFIILVIKILFSLLWKIRFIF